MFYVIRTSSTKNNAAFPNPNSFLSGSMPLEAIYSANREMSGFILQDDK